MKYNIYTVGRLIYANVIEKITFFVFDVEISSNIHLFIK